MRIQIWDSLYRLFLHILPYLLFRLFLKLCLLLIARLRNGATSN